MKLQEGYINQKSKDALMIIENLDDKKHKSQKKKLIDSEESFNQINQNSESNADGSRSEIELSEVNDSGKEIKIKNSNAKDEPFPTESMTIINKFLQNRTKNLIIVFVVILLLILITIIIIYLIKN